MQPLYFGGNQQLFGIYHGPRGNPAPGVRAVVICPPFGQDYIRTHWCLRLLAQQLARKGFHVLRFDYFGIGDSLGEPNQVESLHRWEQDVESALQELMDKSEAESCQLIGLRTGASLAARVAQHCIAVNSLVLWEPVVSGVSWLETTRKLHAEMLDLWVCNMTTIHNRDCEELLGTLYSRKLLDELAGDLIVWDQLQLPNLIVDVRSRQSMYESINNSMQKRVFTDDENSWGDLRQLETAWLRPQTMRIIVDHVEDLFARLTRFGILSGSDQEVMT